MGWSKRQLMCVGILGAGILLVSGCQPPDETFGTTTYTRQQTMDESIDQGGEHLRGSAQTDAFSGQGSWHMESSADDYNYTDTTRFNHNDGSQWSSYRESTGGPEE